MRVRGYGASQRVERGANRMDSRSLSRVRLYSPFARHVFVVSLLARRRMLPRQAVLHARHRHCGRRRAHHRCYRRGCCLRH